MQDRPLFDDESLPLWLRSGGITFAGRKRATSTQAMAAVNASATPEVTIFLTNELPPWMKKADTQPTLNNPAWMQFVDIEPQTVIPPFMKRAGVTETSELSWNQAGNAANSGLPARTGLTGALPWMQGVSDAPSSDERPARPALTGALPWMQGVSDEADRPGQSVSQVESMPWDMVSPTDTVETTSQRTGEDIDIFAAESPLAAEPPTAETLFEPEPEPPAEPPKPKGMLNRVLPTTPEAVPASPDFDWLNNAPAEAAPVDNFDFLHGQSDPVMPIMQPEMDWTNALPSEVAPPETAPTQSTPEPIAFSPSEIADTSDMDWLNAVNETPVNETPIAPTPELEQEQQLTDFSWMDEFSAPRAAPDNASAMPTPQTLSAVQEPPAEPKIRRLGSQQQPGEQTPQEPPKIKKLGSLQGSMPPPDAIEPEVSEPEPELPAANFDDMFAEMGIVDSSPEMPNLDTLFGSSGSFGEPEQPTSSDVELPSFDAMFGAPAADTSAPEMPGDIPDWMRDMAPSEASSNASSATVSSDLPDWMQTFPSADTPAEPEAGLNADIPDWMRDMAPSEASSAAPSSEHDLPDWMQDMPVAEPTPISAGVDTGAGDFDWLSQMDASAFESPATPASETAFDMAVSDERPAPGEPEGFKLDFSIPTSKDIDAILSQAAAEAEAQPEHMAESLPIPPVSEEINLDEAFSDDFEIPILTTPSGSSPDLPRLGGDTFEDESEPNFDAVPAAAPAENLDELPSWVADLKPTAGPVPIKIGDQEVRLEEKPVNQLDDQLRALLERQRKLQRANTKLDEGAPSTGLASGILSSVSGAIDVAPTITNLPTVAIPLATPQATDEQNKRAKIIRSLLELDESAPVESATPDPKAEVRAAAKSRAALLRAGFKIDRLVISLVLVLVIFAPFMSNAFSNVLPVPTQPDSQSMHDAFVGKLKNVGAGKPILVAFEYGPTAAGELDDLAVLLLQDIFKVKGYPVVVSTNAAGILHAESLLSRMHLSSDPNSPLAKAGTDYIVLRYMPGGAAGVHAIANALTGSGDLNTGLLFARDIAGNPTSLTSAVLAQMRTNPALVFAESTDDVRNWAEQYNTSTTLIGAAGNVPASQRLSLLLVSTTASAAVAQAYATSSTDSTGFTRITGPLVGLRDTITYAPGSANPALLRRWQSVGLTALVGGLIILLGMVANAILRAVRSRANREL
jgi:hypothetical protein